MSAEFGRNSLDKRSYLSRPARTAVEEVAFLAEDPDMLRWRADVLMDEMMVGAIDLSANGPPQPSSAPAHTPTFPNAYEPTRARPELHPDIATPAPGRNANGVYRRPAAPTPGNGHHTSHAYPQQAREPNEHTLATTPPRDAQESWLTDTHTPQAPEPEKTLLSAEDRYRRLASSQSSQPPPPRPGPAPATPAASSPWAEEQTWQSNGNGAPRPSRPYSDLEMDQGANGVVRRVSAQVASVMAATAANNRRSNLLPRISAADVEAVQREIFTLQSEIDNVLPTGHESNQRARRLLDKANTILQQDALRSAEVEYYLQQVRTIFQHVQQTIRWSDTYRKRLLVYLAAWLGLAVLVIVACYLFATPLENFVREVGRFSVDHPILRYFLTVTTALFAGALGGACGALINLWQQGRQHSGFIDRKYGLRGLILPLMGALVGLLLAFVLITPVSILQVDLVHQPVLAALPALLAFLFGFSQESIYGTRS